MAGKQPTETNKQPVETKSSEPKKTLTRKELADFLSIELKDALPPKTIQAFLKALPGYDMVLDDVAGKLVDDMHLLALKSVTPQRLLDIKDQQAFFSNREAICWQLYRCSYEQRLANDDAAMKALFAVTRRIEALSEDYPELLDRYKSLLDYMAKFRPGTNAGSQSTEEPAAPPATPPGSETPGAATTAAAGPSGPAPARPRKKPAAKPRKRSPSRKRRR